jgi:squalene-hopene/tetraprenyl-beta-curcumene cyclase
VLLACASSFLREKATVQTRALAWLRAAQNADGGFGGVPGAPSTAEETGLALRALLASGVQPTEAACERAAEWLVARQRDGGSWPAAPIGFYFAVLWYYEELYPLCFALGGLGALAGAFRQAAAGKADATR